MMQHDALQVAHWWLLVQKAVLRLSALMHVLPDLNAKTHS